MIGLLRYLYLSWFSKPSADRKLYRAMRHLRAASIVELGIGDAQRAVRMIGVARRFARRPVRYTGLDLFEARPADQLGITLKAAHRLLSNTGAQVRVVPGEPATALVGAANSLLGTDLLIISADCDPAAMEQAWFFVPRMLHEKSLVFIEERDEAGEARFKVFRAGQVAGFVKKPSRRAA